MATMPPHQLYTLCPTTLALFGQKQRGQYGLSRELQTERGGQSGIEGGGQGQTGDSRVVLRAGCHQQWVNMVCGVQWGGGEGSLEGAANGRACRKVEEKQFWSCASYSRKRNLTGRGKLDLIISNKPLFPCPSKLSQRRGEEDAWPSAGPVCEG